MSFAYYDVERRTAKSKFFGQIDTLIDWSVIERDLIRITGRGIQDRGQKSYNPLILFKMQLVSVWYNLSDVATEEMVNDSLSVMKFCGLELEDIVPDHSTLSRFRTVLTKANAYDRLLNKINKQLAKHELIVKNGKAKVDASLTQSPFSPKGKTTYELAQDRKEDQRSKEDLDKEKTHHQLIKTHQPGVDNQARWVRKNGKSIYGYKKQMATDERGMILAVHTTPANEHDSKGLSGLIKKLGKKQRRQVMADKGYKSKDNDKMLKEIGSKSRIMYKAYRNRPLTEWKKKYNKKISESRWVIERTFGSLKSWFGSGVTRLKTKSKVHSIHVIEAIAHNLKRSPGLVRLVTS